VKEEVRDAVGTYLKPFLEEADDIEETREIVNDHMDEIIEVSKLTLEKNGYNYEVKAKLAHTDFPEKTYGSYTFPKGTYEALEITIGEGAGQNWWCVLYPNLCFIDAVNAVVPQEGKEELKQVLEEDTYKMVTATTPFRIKWFFF
jgi:stage II sporulation protein R